MLPMMPGAVMCLTLHRGARIALNHIAHTQCGLTILLHTVHDLFPMAQELRADSQMQQGPTECLFWRMLDLRALQDALVPRPRSSDRACPALSGLHDQLSSLS